MPFWKIVVLIVVAIGYIYLLIKTNKKK